jgi:hypothetical protein
MSAMESFYNFHLIKGDEYSDGSQYHEAFRKRYEIIERTGWSIASSEMRDLCIIELEDKRMTDHPSYKKLINWETTLFSGGTADIILRLKMEWMPLMKNTKHMYMSREQDSNMRTFKSS